MTTVHSHSTALEIKEEGGGVSEDALDQSESECLDFVLSRSVFTLEWDGL